MHHALLARLESHGASFFAELVQASGGAPQREVFDALWDLVWWGLVTNDTLAPLRALHQEKPKAGRGLRSRRPRRRGAHAPPPASSGRWSLVAQLLSTPANPTERAHAQAAVLLERHGILSRDALSIEEVQAGFSAVYPVLRAMEDAGKIRRGHFVEGFTGAQFAFTAAVDRLRAVREPEASEGATVLAATDPANPYGAVLPWPEATSELARPRRAAGARVVLVAGEPVLYAARGGRALWTFPVSEPSRADAALAAAARALAEWFVKHGGTGIQVATIDGETAPSSDAAAAFAGVGYRSAYRGMEFDRHSLSDRTEA